MISLGRLRRIIVQGEWDKLPMKIVRAAIDSWPGRIRRCIRKRGGHLVSERIEVTVFFDAECNVSVKLVKFISAFVVV